MDGSLDSAIGQYKQKRRTRLVQELKLRKAKELIDEEAWDDALRVLRPLWHSMTWRKEGWWDIVEEVGWTLRTVAANTGDGGSVICVDWELMNQTFPSRIGWTYDITKALEGLTTVTHRPAVVIREQDVHSFLSATLAFEQPEAKVADNCICQLTVTSHASNVSVPIAMAEIRVSFEGGFKPVILRHQLEENGDKAVYNQVPLTEGMSGNDSSLSLQPSTRGSRHAALVGSQDLTFTAGQTRVFEFSIPLRESGQVRASSAKFSMASDLFDLDYLVDFERIIIPDMWWYQKTSRKRIVRIDPYAIHILPKPPKMDVRFMELQDQYYTNEDIGLQLEITNGEDEDSIARLNVHVAGDQAPSIRLTSSQPVDNAADESSGDGSASQITLGTVEKAKSTLATIQIPPSDQPAAYDLIVDLSYTLVSDPETSISRTMSIRLYVVSPFEANYDFSPFLEPNPWPSFFTHEEISAADTPTAADSNTPEATGLSQNWCLTARYASFAVSTLHVSSTSLEILSLHGAITCHTTAYPESSPASSSPISISPNTIEESRFSVTTRKISLDDRRSASLDLSLLITWSRSPLGPFSTTALPVPRLLVASSEPRVLATTLMAPNPSSDDSVIPGLIHLIYTIENPSMHFLTFGIAMNPSEDFAFSGPKSSSLQLTPLSRRTVRFGILPITREREGEAVAGSSAGSREDARVTADMGGRWIKVVFVVRDRYFQKVLRVAPGEGMRGDKEGVLIWVPPPDEDGE
ncbi:MAG: hypothetical protein M1818_004037 [Claussenomyces sp. TS43310]|nr:MAG: hypothetical protein M1818_004037 [Claussenomyces sp. TS43310]